MRLLIIRHAEPDYAVDSLTPKGFREAELLADRLCQTALDHIYVSPLGRAKATAAPTLKRLGRTAVTCDWLREFGPLIHRPDEEQPTCAWDWQPRAWMDLPLFFDREHWAEHPVMQEAGIGPSYAAVTAEFDRLLAAHGYERQGTYYRAVRSNRETLAFFCHFGSGSVLLSHLMNLSPMILWHTTCMAPSSVTQIYTEEREQGAVAFRAQMIGDISHLYAAGEEPSFMARFCETFDSDERH